MQNASDKAASRIKEDRHFVTALARGLEVLHAFRSGEERLSNQELAERCALPKSTVTRLTYTLTKLGYLHHVPDSGRYRLGMATLTLGGTTLSRLDVKEVSQPLLQELANATGTMVTLAIRDDLTMLYIENCKSESSILTLRLGIGSRLPIAPTAAGRAYLAGAPAQERRGLMQRLQALDPAGWPQMEPGIQRAIADLGQQGCVASFGEWKKDVNGIAAPLSLGAALPLMVISAASAAHAIPAQVYLNEVRPLMLATMRSIETRYRAIA